MSQVSKLDLKRKYLQSLSDHIKGINLESIEEVDASENYINEIDIRPLNKLKMLKWMDISSNKIERINENVFTELNNLIYLDLSNNKIEELPENLFRKSYKLVDLYLSNNRINKLPKNIFDSCYNLEWIDVSSNRLDNLNDDLFNNCTKLTYLNISKNFFKESILNNNLTKNCKQLKIKIDFVKSDYFSSFDSSSLSTKLSTLQNENDSTIYYCQLLKNRINEIANQIDKFEL